MSTPTLLVHWSATAAPVDATVVSSPAVVAEVLDRLLRGEHVAVVADPVAPTSATLIDQAGRVAEIRTADDAGLSADAADLLVLLGSGLTTAHAARLLHLSTRTAYRLLAEARAELGVATTAEAVLAVRSRVEATG